MDKCPRNTLVYVPVCLRLDSVARTSAFERLHSIFHDAQQLTLDQAYSRWALTSADGVSHSILSCRFRCHYQSLILQQKKVIKTLRPQDFWLKIISTHALESKYKHTSMQMQCLGLIQSIRS